MGKFNVNKKRKRVPLEIVPQENAPLPEARKSDDPIPKKV